MSHMAALILRANIGLNETNNNNDTESTEVVCRVHPSWSSADERNITVKTKWDNSRLHDEVNVLIKFAGLIYLSIFDSLVFLAMRCGSRRMNNILR